MDFSRLTEKSQQAVAQAQSLATRYGHQQIDVEHVLLAMLRQEEGLVSKILSRLEAPTEELALRLESTLDKLPSVQGAGAGETYLSPRLNKVLEEAVQEAEKLKDQYVSVEHLLLAMVERGGRSG